MGTRTYSRRSASGEQILTRLGRERQANTVFNPSLLPTPLQKIYNHSHAQIDSVFEELMRTLTDLTSEEVRRDLVDKGIYLYDAQDLGLDLRKQADRHLYADIMGYIGEPIRIDDSNRYYPIDPDNPDAGTHRTSAVRNVRVGDDKVVEVKNVALWIDDNAPAGFGYMQFARQLAAVRELARRGKTIQISMQAVNNFIRVRKGYDATKLNGMIGALVWPKMGMEFYIPYRAQKDLEKLGFTKEQLKNTATLMFSQTPDGLSGYDAWDDLFRYEYNSEQVYGKVTITPKDARSNTLTLPERVTQEYGKRKGFLKYDAIPMDSFTTEDNNTLREIWQELARERR